MIYTIEAVFNSVLVSAQHIISISIMDSSSPVQHPITAGMHELHYKA